MASRNLDGSHWWTRPPENKFIQIYVRYIRSHVNVMIPGENLIEGNPQDPSAVY
jgi:hypothetical protein